MLSFLLLILLCRASTVNYYTEVSKSKPVKYGTKGSYAPSNWPPYRGLSFCWTVTDDSVYDPGSFLFFGGLGLVIEEFNDVWEYSRTLGQWRWLNGPDTPNQPEVNKGDYVFDRANVPASRAGGSTMVTDQSTALLIFSGASIIGFKFYSDVWEFNLELRMWRRIRQGITTHAVTGTKRVFDVANSPASGYRWNGFHKLSITRGFKSNAFIGFLGGIDADHAVNQVWVYSNLENQWAFLGGSIPWDNTGKHNPVAAVGCTDPTYVPSARSGHQTWVVDEYLYMFGGGLYMQNYNIDEYADMWRFDIDNGQWCWMSGVISVHNPPVMIPKRFEYDPNIVVAWRASAAFWLSQTTGTDNVHLMVFAGAGGDNYAGCNDVFAYSPYRNEWKYTNGTMIDPSTRFEDNDYPAWRSGVAWWSIESSGEMYFFGGGYGNKSEGTILPYGDLWRYDKVEFGCGEKDRDDPTACSEHGSCVAADDCLCETGWKGSNCEKSASAGLSAGGWVGVGIGISVVFIVAIVVVNVVLCFFCIRRGAGQKSVERTPALVSRRTQRPEQDGSSINAYGTFDGGETASKPKSTPTRRMGSSLRSDEVAAYEQLPRGDDPAPRRKVREPILDEDDPGQTQLVEKDDL